MKDRREALSTQRPCKPTSLRYCVLAAITATSLGCSAAAPGPNSSMPSAVAALGPEGRKLVLREVELPEPRHFESDAGIPLRMMGFQQRYGIRSLRILGNSL